MSTSCHVWERGRLTIKTASTREWEPLTLPRIQTRCQSPKNPVSTQSAALRGAVHAENDVVGWAMAGAASPTTKPAIVAARIAPRTGRPAAVLHMNNAAHLSTPPLAEST